MLSTISLVSQIREDLRDFWTLSTNLTVKSSSICFQEMVLKIVKFENEIGTTIFYRQGFADDSRGRLRG